MRFWVSKSLPCYVLKVLQFSFTSNGIGRRTNRREREREREITRGGAGAGAGARVSNGKMDH